MSNNNHANPLSARAELAVLARRYRRLLEEIDAAQELSRMLRADLLADTDSQETARFTATERHAMAVAIDSVLGNAFEGIEECYEAAGRLGLLS